MITLPEKYRTEGGTFPFSPVLMVEGKKMVVTSGVACDDYDGTLPETIEEQARHTILACEAYLREAGCQLTDVFNVEVYLQDIAQWDAFNRVYKEMMPDPKPCRKALQVGLLPGYLAEMVMWAAK